MIEHINMQLNLWAAWGCTGKTRLGYPNMSAFMRPFSGSGVPPICDDTAMDVHRAVLALEPDLRNLVQAYYVRLRHFPASEIARELSISRDTLYTRLHRAHVDVMNSLNDDAQPITSGYKVFEGKWKAVK